MRKLLLGLMLVGSSLLLLSSAPTSDDWTVVCTSGDLSTGAIYQVMTKDGEIRLVTLEDGKLEVDEIDVVTALRICNLSEK